MSTQYIEKKANTNLIGDTATGAGVGVVNGDLYVHDGSTRQKVLDAGDVGTAYKMRNGVAAVTGTATVVTGLTTVVAALATPQDDIDGAALANVSVTVGNQAGAPAAGSIIIKAWKVTTGGASGNPTEIAATVAKNVNWVAFGT